MDDVQRAFGLSSLVILAALIAIRLSRRLGLPSLLLYLGIGLLLGNRGLGLEFSDTRLTEQLGLSGRTGGLPRRSPLRTARAAFTASSSSKPRGRFG